MTKYILSFVFAIAPLSTYACLCARCKLDGTISLIFAICFIFFACLAYYFSYLIYVYIHFKNKNQDNKWSGRDSFPIWNVKSILFSTIIIVIIYFLLNRTAVMLIPYTEDSIYHFLNNINHKL